MTKKRKRGWDTTQVTAAHGGKRPWRRKVFASSSGEQYVRDSNAGVDNGKNLKNALVRLEGAQKY